MRRALLAAAVLAALVLPAACSGKEGPAPSGHVGHLDPEHDDP